MNTQVTTYGDGLWEREQGWLWHGAAAASDGMIYSIPANARKVGLLFSLHTHPPLLAISLLEQRFLLSNLFGKFYDEAKNNVLA